MSTDTEPRATMDCNELRRLIDAYVDGELAASERDEAHAHLALCGPCRALVQRESDTRAALRAGLRAAMGAGTPAGCAPPELRERIHLALVQREPPAWRRWVTPLRVAALAACAAGALLVVTLHGVRSDSLVDESIQRHVRDLPL